MRETVSAHRELVSSRREESQARRPNVWDQSHYQPA